MLKHDTLLLAGKNKDNRALLRSVLEENYNLLEASNLPQTNLLLEQNIDCIASVLLDMTDESDFSPEVITSEPFAGLLGNIPVIVFVQDMSHKNLLAAFDYGATDVISITYDSQAMLRRIENIVDLHLHKQHLEQLVREQAEQLHQSNEAMVDALSSIIEYRSVESGQHILRIRRFTQLLLEEVARSCPEYNLAPGQISIIASASALHDIGKISIPDSILNKPGKLDPAEWDIMKSHSLTGCKILSSMGDIGNPEYLRYAHNICHYHHERWDGKGYPEGLSGDAIPICAQVVGLADAYDALTSKRVYKDAAPCQVAVNMILNGECGAFSPRLLECFKEVSGAFEQLTHAYADGLSPHAETFDVTLPAPEEADFQSLNMTQAKYQAIVHFMNAFVMEVDLDSSIFHVLYNPYPELSGFHDASSAQDLYRLVLENIIAPQDRSQAERFLLEELPLFIEEGLRRISIRLRTAATAAAPEAEFEITLLRPNTARQSRRQFNVVCRKAEDTRPLSEAQPFRLPDGCTCCCRYDRNFTLVTPGSANAALAGYTFREIQEVLGNRLIELVYPEDREKLREDFRRQFSQGSTALTEHRIRDKEGNIYYFFNRSHLFTGPDGKEYLYTYLTDISYLKREAHALSQKLERYEIILAQTENVLFEWDMGKDRISFSDTWAKIFGSQPINSGFRSLLLEGSYFHPDDLPLFLDKINALEAGSNYEMVEVRIATARGNYLWCRIRTTAIRGENNTLSRVAGIIININDEKLEEQALQERAERDSLTKLLNKNAGRKQITDYLRQYPGGINCALLILDLDDFKLINDRHGHLFGDSVLSQVAKNLKKMFRAQDILCRIGGDEFLVLMRGTSDRNLVEARCQRLLASFRELFRSQPNMAGLSCSVGVALAPENGTTYQELFQRADTALYRAKRQGKNSCVFFRKDDPDMNQSGPIHTAVSKRIDSDEQPGLADNSLVLHAFHKLYSSSDTAGSVNELLATVGRALNVSRVYVFENSPDNRFCSNTFEWCAPGISPEINNLQNISYEEDLPGYQDNFNEQGIFYCPDVSELPPETYQILAAQGIKAMLQCAILEGGVFQGYIGFDDCHQNRWWTKEQIQALTFFADMLSVFLLKHRDHQQANQQANAFRSILDNQNSWVYIIDPDTCAIKYLNAKSKQLAPQAQPGMFCYKELMGQSARCPGCPAMNIREKKNQSLYMNNPRFGFRMLSDATLIELDGKEACLLTCREVNPDGLLAQIPPEPEK